MFNLPINKIIEQENRMSDISVSVPDINVKEFILKIRDIFHECEKFILFSSGTQKNEDKRHD